MTHDVAIAHDQLLAHGGAEEVAFELARTFDAPIYAGAVDEDVVPPDIQAVEVFDDTVGTHAMRSHYLVQDLYQMLAWQHVEELYSHEVVIQNKNNPGWFVPKDTQTVVKFCHSTPRGAYDQFHRRGKRLLPRMLKMPIRALYRQNISYIDAWAANSEIVQRRIQSYWDIPPARVNVIYPPVQVESYGEQHAETQAEYYFTFSRLHEHKRIGEIVEAFAGRDERLVVGGEGPDRDRLERLAGDNVEFVGYMDEDEKRRRLAESKAFIFAAENEDFGIVPVEALASGTAVLGVDDGYTAYQVLDGKNGRRWERGELETAIQQFETRGVAWSSEKIQSFADQFGADRFRDEMRALVDRAVENTAVEVPWEGRDEEQTTAQQATVRPDGGERR